MKLKVDQQKTGTITFYTENIGSTNDVYKGSISSSNKITIGEGYPQQVTGTQEFVFKGGTAPSGTLSTVNSSRGPNFDHNLCVKKVRYSLSNAIITSDTKLKNQYVRAYAGLYGYGNTRSKALIMNNGNTATRGGSNNPIALFVHLHQYQYLQVLQHLRHGILVLDSKIHVSL